MLFHELFHLVLGYSATNPPGGREVYNLAEMGDLLFPSASCNPESFNMLAVAYDYTLYSPVIYSPLNQYPQYVEFWTGYATQG